ncbi:MAG: DUF5689 domain-containing protein [Bacteroidales bacterium]|nr:DUF5689 domain-containing protein [Bacteroidales bacterium]
MKKTIFFAALLLSVASCGLKEEFQPVGTLKYEDPKPYAYVDDDFFLDQDKTIITIGELASKYTPQKPFVMDDDYVIKGRVTTTDKPGNFYKSFYIQDYTGGMEIKIGKNGLYNDYLEGQTVYVDCNDLTLGMYGWKDGNYGGMGMVQVGFSDPSGEYETSYLEVPYLIESHIYRGNPADIEKVEPRVIEEFELPDGASDTQLTNENVGALVTLRGLTYADEIFVLLYLDSNKDKKSFKNRVFLSDTNGIEEHGKTHGVTTWAMSKSKMKEYLYAGLWDKCQVGSGKDFLKDDKGNVVTLESLKGEDGTYPTVEKAAYSVSQYFRMGGTEIQIRTSGYSKFCDREIPEEVLSGDATLDVTGILTIYQGSLQLVVNDISDFVVNGEPLK